jgi:hypothetical protein
VTLAKSFLVDIRLDVFYEQVQVKSVGRRRLEAEFPVKRAGRRAFRVNQNSTATDDVRCLTASQERVFQQCLADSVSLFGTIDGQSRQNDDGHRVGGESFRDSHRRLVTAHGAGSERIVTDDALSPKRDVASSRPVLVVLVCVLLQISIEGRRAAIEKAAVSWSRAMGMGLRRGVSGFIEYARLRQEFLECRNLLGWRIERFAELLPALLRENELRTVGEIRRIRRVVDGHGHALILRQPNRLQRTKHAIFEYGFKLRHRHRPPAGMITEALDVCRANPITRRRSSSPGSAGPCA